MVWKIVKIFRFCLHISDCFRFAGIGSLRVSSMRLPQKRRRTLPPPQPPRGRSSCNGTTCRDGGGCDCRPGDMDGGFNVGNQNFQEGNGGGLQINQGQSCRRQSHRLPLVIGQSAYIRVYNVLI